MDHRKGFFSTEIVVILGIALMLSLTLARISGCLGLGSKESAELYAHDHVTDMNWKFVAVSCAHSDSDLDGYIACTLHVTEKGSETVVEKNLECGSGAALSRTGGCKASPGLEGVLPN